MASTDSRKSHDRVCSVIIPNIMGDLIHSCIRRHLDNIQKYGPIYPVPDRFTKVVKDY